MPPRDVLSSDSDITSEDYLTANNEKERQGGYVCSVADCGLRFNRQTKLDRHEYKHTGLRKHVCKFEGCNKSYTIITHLKRHVKMTHENFRAKKDVTCPLESCNSKFNSVYNMERHMKDVHENPKIYPCPNCSNEFNRKIQLRRHIVTHTGEYPFKCDKCSKGFLLQRLYNKHNCDRKNYKCQICEKVFEKWSLLVAHRKADHVNSYKCEECGKMFKRKEYLKVHIESHKDEAERQVLKCPWESCDRFYYHSRNLKSHIRSKHEGAKYKCSVEGCGKELATKQKLEYHIRLHEITPGVLKTTKCAKPKKVRSDKGKKKKSYASVLSGVVLKGNAEKAILDGQGKDIDVVAPDTSEVTDTDEDASLSRRVLLVEQY